MDQQVIEIAKKVRKWSERKAQKLGFSEDLCGLCAISTGELSKRLKRRGIKSKIHIAKSPCNSYENHVFLSVDDKIIDVTATQFGHESKVKVIPIKKAESEYYWKPYKTIEGTNNLVEHQKRIGWAEDQIAYEWKKESRYERQNMKSGT